MATATEEPKKEEEQVNESKQYEMTAPLAWLDMNNEITLEKAKKMGLCTGVAMQEGMAHGDGHIVDAPQIYSGTGGLRAAGRLGAAYVDVSHDGNPVGRVIDAAAVKYQKDNILRSEVLMAVTDPHWYEQIKKGEIVGLSVDDKPRKHTCDENGKACKSESSAFAAVTLVPRGEQPASKGTYIRPVNQQDIDTMNRNRTDRQALQIQQSQGYTMPKEGDQVLNVLKELETDKEKPKPQIPTAAPPPTAPQTAAKSLQSYRAIDGTWASPESLKSYMIEQKQLPADEAAIIAEHIKKHPANYSPEAIEQMTTQQYERMYDKLRMATLEEQVGKLSTYTNDRLNNVHVSQSYQSQHSTAATKEDLDTLGHQMYALVSAHNHIQLTPHMSVSKRTDMVQQRQFYMQKINLACQILRASGRDVKPELV